jgi:hypothetical protein
VTCAGTVGGGDSAYVGSLTPLAVPLSIKPCLPERVAVMEAELRPDHGISLRGAISRVEDGVRRVEDGLAAHLEQRRIEQTRRSS